MADMVAAERLITQFAASLSTKSDLRVGLCSRLDHDLLDSVYRVDHFAKIKVSSPFPPLIYLPPRIACDIEMSTVE